MAKTQKEMLTELYQKVVGIPENPLDNGIIGDINEICENIKSVNGTVRSNVERITRVEAKVEGVEVKVDKLRDMPRPVRVTPRQTAIGGMGVITFLGLLLVAVGKILGWW